MTEPAPIPAVEVAISAESSNDKDTKPTVAGTIPPVSANGKLADVKPKPVLSEQAAARVDEIMKKIAAQVEFYLSDFNLAGDKFFRDLVEKDEEGWVVIDNFMKCNRVKKFTSNPDDVVTSLKKFSKNFEVDEQGKRVKRMDPFVPKDPAMLQAEREERTVHAKRFPKSATVDAIHEYFSRFGPIEGFVQNKFQEGEAKLKGKFKGSVDCIYRNKVDAEAFLAAPEEKTKFDGREMRRLWKKQHAEEKDKRMTEKREEIERSKIPGSVLHISSHRNIDYIPVREFFEKHSPLRYLDCQRGQKEARVRFQASVAKEVLDNIMVHNNNKLIIDGKQFKAKVLDEKEEQRYFATYWDTYIESKNNRILRDMRNDSKNQFRFNPPNNNSTDKVVKSETKNGTTTGGAVEETDVKVESESEARIVAAESPAKDEEVTKKRTLDDSGPESKKIKSEAVHEEVTA